MRGHVRKRGNRWCFVVELGRDPKTGKRRQQWTSGFPTEDAAEQALTRELARLDSGQYVERSRLTVAAFLEDEWLPLHCDGLRPSTARSYRQHIKRYIVPRIGDVLLQKLTTAHVNGLYRDLLVGGGRDQARGKPTGRPLSKRSVRYTHTILRRALRDAVAWGRVARNVTDAAKPPSAKSAKAPPMKTWTAEELRRFFTRAREDRLYPLFLLYASTGLRRGEALGLRWWDLDGHRLSIRRTWIDGGVESLPKTDSSARSVALDAGTVAALREWRKRQAEEQLAIGPAYANRELIFSDELGEPLLPSTASWRFQWLAKEADLPVIRLHDLRHTHASLALQAGVHVKVVSERLGHASIAITLDTYSHAIPALHEEAAETVAALVFGAAG